MSVEIVNGSQLSSDLEDIADAIRAKTGSSAPIPYTVGDPSNFINAIASIPSFEPSIDGVQFNAEGIRLPFTLNANHRVKVDFFVDEYKVNMNIVGNTANNYQRFHLTQYNNKYYTTGSPSYDIIITASLTGRHTYDFNTNSNIKFDDVVVVDNQGNPITIAPETYSTIYYTIGFRNTVDFTGKIYRFTIWDNTDDSLVCDLQAYGKNGDADCLYDVVNDKIYVPQKRS